MNSAILFGVVTPWISQWLTPIWLICVGVSVGLIACVLFYGVTWVLSRITGLGRLTENPTLRRNLILAVGGLLFVGLLIYGATKGPGEKTEGDEQQSSQWVTILALAPFCWLLPATIIYLSSRRAVDEIRETLSEGVLLPMSSVALGMAGFSLLGLMVVTGPGEFWHSVKRLRDTGTTQVNFDLAANKEGASGELGDTSTEQEVPVSFRRDEVRAILVTSSETIEIRTTPLSQDLNSVAGVKLEIQADTKPVPWPISPQTVNTVFPSEVVSKLYVRNMGAKAGTIKFQILTQPKYPEVLMIPVIAVSVLAIFLLYSLQRIAAPKASAVGLATFKSETAQPLFMLIMILGSVALGVFVFVPYNTFGEDIKLLKGSGMVLIMVLAIIQAVWASSTSIAEEIEGRTALTVLSKPLNRRSFIIGKFLGISWTVALMFVVLGILFLIVVAYKPIYDAKEGSSDDPTWQICFSEAVGVVPGLVLAFMQTLVLTAISVAISTRLPMLANFVICGTIYVLGNLTPMIVVSSAAQLPIVRFVGQLIATVVPNLESFNIEAAIAGGRQVPLDYLGYSFVYSMLYAMIALCLALIMFEDRDLA